MRGAILVVLLLCVAFLFVVMFLAMRAALRMGDQTSGWTRVLRHLAIYKIPPSDRPVKFGYDDLGPRDDDSHDSQR